MCYCRSGNNDGRGPSGWSRGRGARARIQTAATTLFHPDRIRSHRSGAANRRRQRVETHVLSTLFPMMSSSRCTCAASTKSAGCPSSRLSTPPTPRRAVAHQPPIASPAVVPAVHSQRRCRGRARCKPLGMLDAVNGTPIVTARPAARGGRGARERILTAATTLFHREGIPPPGWSG